MDFYQSIHLCVLCSKKIGVILYILFKFFFFMVAIKRMMFCSIFFATELTYCCIYYKSSILWRKKFLVNKGNWIPTPLHTVDYWNPIFHSALHSRWRTSSNQSWNPTSDVSKRIYFIHIFNTQKSQVGETTLRGWGEATLLMESMLCFQTSKNRCLNTSSWIQVAICFGHCWFPDNSC